MDLERIPNEEERLGDSGRTAVDWELARLELKEKIKRVERK